MSDDASMGSMGKAFEQSDVPINYSYNIWESNKEKKYHSIKIVPASKSKIVETETKLIPLTHMHMTSVCWSSLLVTCISKGRVLLVHS
jgi:hypothetical protein